MTDLAMIAYDGTDGAKRAIEYAARFLSVQRAVVVTAWEPYTRQAARMSGLAGVATPDWATAPANGSSASPDWGGSEAEQINAEGVALARAAGLDASGSCAECGSTIWSTLVDAADRLDADIVVAGTRALTGVRGLLQSSVSDHVLRHSRRPVLVVPPEV